MHQIIRTIVYAKTKENALEEAERVFGGLCGEDKVFDYYTLFNDNTSKVSGKARWGELPPVVLAKGKEGKKLINEGFETTKKSFMDNIKSIKKLINNFSDEELFEGKSKEKTKEEINLYMFKFYCHCAGMYKGIEIFLYDSDGEGIRDSRHLKNALNKWVSVVGNKYKDLKIWVIPADVHS